MSCESEAVLRLLLLCLLFFSQGVVIADGSVIDKVYHPYVQPEEREIEFRSIIEKTTVMRMRAMSAFIVWGMASLFLIAGLARST